MQSGEAESIANSGQRSHHARDGHPLNQRHDQGHEEDNVAKCIAID